MSGSVVLLNKRIAGFRFVSASKRGRKIKKEIFETKSAGGTEQEGVKAPSLFVFVAETIVQIHDDFQFFLNVMKCIIAYLK